MVGRPAPMPRSGDSDTLVRDDLGPPPRGGWWRAENFKDVMLGGRLVVNLWREPETKLIVV